jgi:hypothetical protein
VLLQLQDKTNGRAVVKVVDEGNLRQRDTVLYGRTAVACLQCSGLTESILMLRSLVKMPELLL